ncbi:zinc-binding dehydrogenase [Paenibacillus elgii]|uniref:zinc-binding dehydrogenase n=1 Tax=Paenibacillus elgii TaxID=189691 RepID=UPI000FD9E3BA|nr:zinc-binding dehydrogenase [Paenibacillus elgii]NEN82646.1 zinc-binding dehydrogenase [Paenibacillus elgii]
MNSDRLHGLGSEEIRSGEAVTTRRVARARRAGGPEVIEVAEEELAPLKSGEALVRVEAVGLNHVESLVRSGTYPIRFPFPYGVGVEGAGVVLAVGPEVSVPVGTRVCWTGVPGSCATAVIAQAAMLVPLPDPLTFEDGASLAHAGLTAGGLARHWPLGEGSAAVVWGAAGAVGRLLVATLAERGVEVIGIASGGERLEAVRAAGAALAVDRSAEGVQAAVRAFTGGRGAAAVFDPVGTETYKLSLRLLARRGCLINYGQLSGDLPSVDMKELMTAGSVFVTKYGPGGVEGPSDMAGLIADAVKLAVKRPLTSGVAGRFALDQVADAYRALDSGAHGKVLVIPGGTAL